MSFGDVIKGWYGGGGAAGRMPPLPSSTGDNEPVSPLTLPEEASKPGSTRYETGFDPTALERGAKAIREINASPHADEALRLAKMQETTRQHELAVQLEMARTQQYEHQRAAEEARRGRLREEEEQARRTAEYQARLQQQLNERKLQDRKKYDEEQLSRQRQEFMRQEEFRRQTEAKIQAERQRTIEKENEARKELAKTQALAEAEGRIKEERANKDIILEKLRTSKEQDRTTKLATIQEWGKQAGDWGRAVNDTLTDRQKMASVALGVGAVCLAIYGARTTTHTLGRFVESRIGKPSLVRETSRLNFRSLLHTAQSPVKTMAQLVSKRKDIFDGIIFPADLHARLSWVARGTVNTKNHGAAYRHMMFHGPPGTGKTLFARSLALNSGLDYAIISGGDFAPLGKDAVTQLHKVFDWAEASRKGTILFIDEADAFLRSGREGGTNMSEDMRNCLSAFLQRTGADSDRFMLILTSNLPLSHFDFAVRDRIDECIEFPYPGLEEREAMLRLYFDRYIKSHHLTWRQKLKGARPIITEGFEDKEGEVSPFQRLSEMTDGFSGRQLSKLMIAMRAVVYGHLSPKLTPQAAEAVLKFKLSQNEHLGLHHVQQKS